MTRLQLDEDRGEIIVEVESSPDRQMPCVALIPRAMCVVIPDVTPEPEAKPEPPKPEPEPVRVEFAKERRGEWTGPEPEPSPETEKSFEEVRRIRLDKPPKKTAKKKAAKKKAAKRGRPRKKS